MPSRKMRTAIYLFYGLDVEIRPKLTPPSCLSTLVGNMVILHLLESQYVVVRRVVAYRLVASLTNGYGSGHNQFVIPRDTQSIRGGIPERRREQSNCILNPFNIRLKQYCQPVICDIVHGPVAYKYSDCLIKY